jgi:hypothetical protein
MPEDDSSCLATFALAVSLRAGQSAGAVSGNSRVLSNGLRYK